MKNTLLAITVAAAGFSASANVANDWENLAVNSINRLPPRAYSMPLESIDDAFTDKLEPDTPYKMSLNGVWKFSWAGEPSARVKDFYKTDFDDSKWFDIDVPSCVEMRGWGVPGYTNIRYPHKMEWPRILDRKTGKADYNPVSSYRRTFTIPEKWDGREIILRFDGVYSAYYVWINGKKVGYAEDSKLPSEFNISSFLTKGENLIAVEVYRWCDGSYVEDQDMFRFSGIFRDVTLWAKPKSGIWDFAVETEISDDFKSATLLVTGDRFDEIRLYDAAGKEILKKTRSIPEKIIVDDVKLWSAEKPYLYTLVLKKGDDIRMKRVGFKNQKIVGNTILVNGKMIKFKGVNRHETNPENGRAITISDMLRDVELMKKYNINTVRTSHYPNHHLWYDICDRYGIYLVAEANVEAHEPGYGKDGLGGIKQWDHTIVERNARHVVFYRNHPSVTLWSLGNETGHGDCFRNAAKAIREIDSTRPIHWERGNVDVDVDSCMYPGVEWIERRGVLGTKPKGETIEDHWTGIDGNQFSHKPFFLCEYAHAMGNAIGNFQEYWDEFYKYDALTGGCIWDWIDQAVWKSTDEIDPKTGKRARILAYGGDFDEIPNDGPFCCNGVIDPNRNVTPKLIEVGHVHRNLVVTLAPGEKSNENGPVYEFELWNRYGFTNANEFDGEWELLSNGRVIEKGEFQIPDLAPLSKTKFKLEIKNVLLANECFVNFSFKLKEDTFWAKKGWTVARDQVKLSGEFASWTGAKTLELRHVKVSFDESDASTFTMEGARTTAIFDRKTGSLTGLVMRGKSILADGPIDIIRGPHLTCGRAFVDNDGVVRGQFYDSGLSQLNYHARPIEKLENGVRIITEVTGAKSASFTHEAIWTINHDGSLEVVNHVTPHGTMPEMLPRLGLSMMLDQSLENMTWYGRGPSENYIDRLTGSFVGLYSSTVTDQFVDYVRPQDNGYKSDVRYAEFTDRRGHGVKFSASNPLFVQALHYERENMEFSRHRNGQQRFATPLVKRDEVFLNLDVRQLGLGGGSCGPIAIKKYRFNPNEKVSWSMKIERIKK